jgi:hypothetical protein
MNGEKGAATETGGQYYKTFYGRDFRNKLECLFN